jgi:hypothetical protein
VDLSLEKSDVRLRMVVELGIGLQYRLAGQSEASERSGNKNELEIAKLLNFTSTKTLQSLSTDSSARVLLISQEWQV